MERKPRRVGIAWYRPDAYDQLREVLSAGSDLPKTFDSWHQRATKAEELLYRQGQSADRVYVDPREFTQWCQTQGLQPDTTARAKFVTAALARKYDGR